MLRDVELKFLKLGVYTESMYFMCQPQPKQLTWTRYSGEARASSSWVEQLSQTQESNGLTTGVLGAPTLPGALAVSPDCDLILKKLEAGEEVLATLFTLTYHFGDIAYLTEDATRASTAPVPLLGLKEERGYPQLVRLKKTGVQPLKQDGLKPIKGISYEWAVSPIKRRGTAFFLDDKIRQRFTEVAKELGVEVELVSADKEQLPYKRTDRVSNRHYTVERFTYEVPSELDISALWQVMDEQFALLDRKRVDIKTLASNA